MATQSQRHSLGDVWKAVNQQGNEISEIKAAQRGTDQKLIGVTDGIRRLEGLFHELADRQNRPTNWLGVASLFFTIVAGFVVFVSLQIHPLQNSDADLKNDVAEIRQTLLDRAYVMGQDNKELEWHRTWLGFVENQLDVERARNADIEERVSRTEGRLEMMIEKIQEIDTLGSRRWNESPK